VQLQHRASLALKHAPATVTEGSAIRVSPKIRRGLRKFGVHLGGSSGPVAPLPEITFASLLLLDSIVMRPDGLKIAWRINNAH
jgi:hypothetical protein